MMKIHATCNETKRILSLQKGGEVKELRHRFLQVFSDVFLDQVAPADVKLQRYDPSFEDYVELNSDEKIEDDTKIRALVSKQDKQVRNKHQFFQLRLLLPSLHSINNWFKHLTERHHHARLCPRYLKPGWFSSICIYLAPFQEPHPKLSRSDCLDH